MTAGLYRLIVDNSFLPALIAEIELAKKEILISTFKIDPKNKKNQNTIQAIFKAIHRAAQNGIKIKILTNIHTGRNFLPLNNLRAAFQLKTAGVEIRGFKKDKIIHAKYFLIDNTSLIIGSHNITQKALTANHEVSILIRDTAGFNYIRNCFFTLWQDAVP